MYNKIGINACTSTFKGIKSWNIQFLLLNTLKYEQQFLMCFFKTFPTIKISIYQCIPVLTDLICSDLSMRGGIRSNVAVQEVTNGGRGVHHVHSLHVQLEQVLGCTADQLRYDNGLKIKSPPIESDVLLHTATQLHFI